VFGQGLRELRLVAADRKAEDRPNVTTITFQLSRFDRLGGPERRGEIWVRIFFD
jgi:hypothetical protein